MSSNEMKAIEQTCKWMKRKCLRFFRVSDARQTVHSALVFFFPVDVHFKQLSETGSIILFSIVLVLKCCCFWYQDMCRDLWMWRCFICAQGLGLLINLVEYSARNRHYLVDMEFDLSYLMVMEVDVKTENDVKREVEEESKTDEQNEDKTEGEKGPTTAKSSNALAALVQVIVVFVFGLRDAFIWPCKCLSLNLITWSTVCLCSSFLNGNEQQG